MVILLILKASAEHLFLSTCCRCGRPGEPVSGRLSSGSCHWGFYFVSATFVPDDSIDRTWFSSVTLRWHLGAEGALGAEGLSRNLLWFGAKGNMVSGSVNVKQCDHFSLPHDCRVLCRLSTSSEKWLSHEILGISLPSWEYAYEHKKVA